jgi:hypothetical protein
MDDKIVKYIQSHAQWPKNQASRHRSYREWKQLELDYILWSSIAINFIMDLHLSDACNQLSVMIDRFTKMMDFISQKNGCHKSIKSWGGISARDIEIIGDIYHNSVRPGLVIYIAVMEGIPNFDCGETSDVDCVPFRDQWPNRESLPDHRSLIKRIR